MKRRSLKIRSPREDEGTKLARKLLPSAQIIVGAFQAIDVQNHTEADQRRMVRSGEKRTVRRRSHLEHLAKRLHLEEREAAACQWYADAHSARYDTLNCTASYGDGSRGERTNFDHLPNSIEQENAAIEFAHARSAIAAPLRLMFDRIVLQEWHVGASTEFLFRLAARQVMHAIEGFVEL